jgi:hypothetical protein
VGWIQLISQVAASPACSAASPLGHVGTTLIMPTRSPARKRRRFSSMIGNASSI